jgi:methionyl-tRNA formyltransferase
MDKEQIADTNLVVGTFYRSGILGISQLLNIGFDRDQIRVLTHDINRNEDTIAFLERENIEFTTDSIEEDSTQQWVAEFEPDLILSLYYRDIIPKHVLEIPEHGGVNIHPSLLPKYRGVLSVPWAMFNGDDKTGYTYHYMTEDVDTGNIIHQQETEILPDDTAYSLYHRIIHAAMTDLLPVLEKALNGYEGEPQTGESSYHFRGDLPNDGYIDNSWDDEKIDRFIQAMYYPPFPNAMAKFGDKEFEVTAMTEYRLLRKQHGSPT